MKRDLSPPDAWLYTLPNGFEIKAGKTDADNDRLSLEIARANDYWFHVSGIPGSHVILRHPDQLTPDRETLRTAAALAAWHSKSRHAGKATVSYTQAKYVSKPRGARSGSVTFKKAKTLKVKPEQPTD
ncbi:MAG: NFACT RNA binding domain-containing protein [Coraliomargaritaceae bacterium]